MGSSSQVGAALATGSPWQPHEQSQQVPKHDQRSRKAGRLPLQTPRFADAEAFAHEKETDTQTADRMGLEHEERTGSILGAAIEVHQALGPGFLESVHEKALAIELEARGVRFERQLAVPILYRGAEVGWHRLDLLVAGSLVVELKEVKTIEDVHFAVVRSYLRATERRHGLILNVAKPTLLVKRVVVSLPPHQDFLVSWLP